MRAGATIYIGTSLWQMISSNLSSARLMFILPRHRRLARLFNSLRTMSWVEVLLLLSVHSFLFVHLDNFWFCMLFDQPRLLLVVVFSRNFIVSLSTHAAATNQRIRFFFPHLLLASWKTRVHAQESGSCERQLVWLLRCLLSSIAYAS
jgi:hypothetical protein